MRLKELDGLRALAIILVAGFHYFRAVPAFVPYGDRFSSFFLVKYGYLGVELFFMISGFVIAMTLETCNDPIQFLYKRFYRLWPPLAICATLTFVLVRISGSPFSTEANQTAINFLPSLTFTAPELWHWISPNVRLVDFSYWSLSVEVRFYILAAILFWLFGRKRFALNLVAVSVLNIIFKTALKLGPAAKFNGVYAATLVPEFLPWFAAGAVFYELRLRRVSRMTAFALLSLMFLIIARYAWLDERGSPIVIAGWSFCFFLIFWLVATRESVPILSRKSFVWLGECSYSFYLLHFEIGIVALSFMPKDTPLPVQLTGVALVFLTITAVARISYLSIETRLRTLLLGVTTGHRRPFPRPVAKARSGGADDDQIGSLQLTQSPRQS
jgi:peptidoglycan/LPS O-acetylase OafA/YrhL